MRELVFDVDQQRLKRNPDCNFEGIVAGSEGYLKLKFNFLGDDWDNCVKIASFIAPAIDGDIGVKLDTETNTCLVPPEASMCDEFAVSLVGAKLDYKIPTNYIRIKQEVR
jgi:hypothetical protein